MIENKKCYFLLVETLFKLSMMYRSDIKFRQFKSWEFIFANAEKILLTQKWGVWKFRDVTEYELGWEEIVKNKGMTKETWRKLLYSLADWEGVPSPSKVGNEDYFIANMGEILMGMGSKEKVKKGDEAWWREIFWWSFRNQLVMYFDAKFYHVRGSEEDSKKVMRIHRTICRAANGDVDEVNKVVGDLNCFWNYDEKEPNEVTS